jgi:hypothetical protein
MTPRCRSRRTRTKTCEGTGAGLARCRDALTRTPRPLTPIMTIALLRIAAAPGPPVASLACARLRLPSSSVLFLLFHLANSVKLGITTSTVPTRGVTLAATVLALRACHSRHPRGVAIPRLQSRAATSLAKALPLVPFTPFSVSMLPLASPMLTVMSATVEIARR